MLFEGETDDDLTSMTETLFPSSDVLCFNKLWLEPDDLAEFVWAESFDVGNVDGGDDDDDDDDDDDGDIDFDGDNDGDIDCDGDVCEWWYWIEAEFVWAESFDVGNVDVDGDDADDCDIDCDGDDDSTLLDFTLDGNETERSGCVWDFFNFDL